MQTNESNAWEELYAAAVFETDPANIPDRISVAQDALRERWQRLHRMPLARDRERRRVEDALRTLNLISKMEEQSPAQ